MSAPVCHIPGTDRDIDQPVTTQQAIPIATTDLNNLVNVVNMLRAQVLRLSGQSGNDTAGTGRAPKIPQEQKRVQWKEQARTVEKVKVYQNNDKSSSNWVEVEQINRLVMVDKNTGQTWEWRRK